MKGERGRDERRKEEDSKQKRKEENLDFENQEANMCKKIVRSLRGEMLTLHSSLGSPYRLHHTSKHLSAS